MPRRILEGKVVSNKCINTLTVLVERKVKDPMYGKIIRRSAKYAAHDESGKWQIGDVVSIEECRPISKRKSWKVVGGKAMGESQAKIVDEADSGAHKTVKRGKASEEEQKEGAEE
ncbi:MAG: 30S ribosomal protein S17 [Alphaproteobacteria bacterium]|nr:30S ribosomal protein S17 [Alphaproteobacteria bacterium]